MIPKSIYLRDAIQKGSKIKEIEAAWSQLSDSEIKELIEGKGGQERSAGVSGALVFNETDFSPFHEAVRYNNLAAVKFFLVSTYEYLHVSLIILCRVIFTLILNIFQHRSSHVSLLATYLSLIHI